MISHVLQAIVVVLVVVKLEALARKKRWGWLVAMSAEVPWLILCIFYWQTWGGTVLSVLYAAWAFRGWKAWRRG